VRELRQPEVQDLRVTVAGYEDIRGLDVAVNNLFGMGSIQPIGNLDAQVQQGAGIEALFDTVLECGAIEKFHSDKRLVFVGSDFVDGADIGVAKGRRSTGLPAEPFQSLRVLGQLVGKELQRNEAAKVGVERLVHHAHTTTADLFENAVARNGRGDHPVIVVMDRLIVRFPSCQCKCFL
jgi:hypothetical protein